LAGPGVFWLSYLEKSSPEPVLALRLIIFIYEPVFFIGCDLLFAVFVLRAILKLD
jgi:hypothetical protein